MGFPLSLDLNQQMSYIDKASELKAEFEKDLEEANYADNQNKEARLHSPFSQELAFDVSGGRLIFCLSYMLTGDS